MRRSRRNGPGALLALVLVSAVASCAEPTVPLHDRPTVATGKADPGFRVALREADPSGGVRTLEQTIVDRTVLPAQGIAPVPGPVPAGCEPPAEVRAGDKLSEEKCGEAGQAPEEPVVNLPTKGRGQRPEPDAWAQRSRPAGDDELARPATETRSAAVTGGVAEAVLLPTERERMMPTAPLPPPPPPVQSPASTVIGAPPLPAPTALRSDETAPADSGRLEAARGGGAGLPAYTVRSLLRRREAALQRCYDGLLLRTPSTGSGNLTVRLRIEPSGDVEQLDLVGGTIDDDEFERCVLEQLRRVDFPAADTPTVFTHSFSFAPAGAAAPLTE